MKRKSWLRRNGFDLFIGVSFVIVVGLLIFTVAQTFNSEPRSEFWPRPYTYEDHPEHWGKAYKIGANVPVGGNMDDAKVFIAWRRDAYGENWKMSIYTCSYGQFVERIA
jgi:hypothetical protein